MTLKRCIYVGLDNCKQVMRLDQYTPFLSFIGTSTSLFLVVVQKSIGCIFITDRHAQKFDIGIFLRVN